ncbi:MAG: CRISPR-associated endonuclease Cas1 [Nitrosotalea sp.]
MNPLLISGFGTSINVEKRKLVISNKLKNKKLEFYPHQIDHDSIIVDGHTGSITFESMRWLMKHDINLTLLNWNGNLLGITLPQEPKAGKLRIKQYEKYLNSESRFEIALKIVQSKTANSVNLLKELATFYDEIDLNSVNKLVENERKNYQFLFNQVQNKQVTTRKESISNSFNKLMNYEGRIALVYLEQLRKIFVKLSPEFNFQGRMNKSNSWNNNASDEINALLNYGYAILESEIRKCINSIGLDPAIGFLHEVAPSKSPLVYDLQELFRWIIDLSVIQLLEENKLKKSDFILTENYHIRLKENTAKLLIDKIRINFNNKVSYKNKKNYAYQSILFDNIQKLANFILEKDDKLIEFYVPRIIINKNDSLELRNKILDMTIEERKRLGIGKTTYWYMKKNLQDGKRIKIYDKVLSKLNPDKI